MTLINQGLFLFCASASPEKLLHKCSSELTKVINQSDLDKIDSLTKKIDTLSNIIIKSNFGPL